jgi:predicted nucleic acid-binding protein
MSSQINEFQGDTLYLDTMILYLFLRLQDSATEPLMRRIQVGEIRAYTSVLTFDELVYRLLLTLIRDKYGGSPLDRLRQDERSMIAEFHPFIEPKLLRLQDFPNLTLLDITPADLRQMNQNMRNYLLRPRDALHLAAMQKVNCFNLVSQDKDFDHIPSINRYTVEP